MANPNIVCQIRSCDFIDSQGGRWTRFGAIDIAEKVISNEECLELNFPGHIIASGELEWSLSGDVDGY